MCVVLENCDISGQTSMVTGVLQQEGL